MEEYFLELESNRKDHFHWQDYGNEPFVTNIEEDTEKNGNYRTALWTGKHLQLTLMSIPVGGEIGLEIHPDTDQFLRVENGAGVLLMGKEGDSLDIRHWFCDGAGIIVPAGTWHNVINTGSSELKLFSVYAPPHHPHSTLQETKAQADQEEKLNPKQVASEQENAEQENAEQINSEDSRLK